MKSGHPKVFRPQHNLGKDSSDYSKLFPSSQNDTKQYERPSLEVQQKMVGQASKMFTQKALEVSHHPKEWWHSLEHPERKHLLYDVIGEITENDSEDELGKPQYQPAKCRDFKRYMEQQKAKVQENRKIIQRTKLENKKLEQHGRKPIPVPAELQIDQGEVDKKKKEFEKQFYRRHDKDQQIYVKQNQLRAGAEKGSHDPNNKFMTNQLNISVMNTGLSLDRRIEMGIIAQQQRRRFNQVRRLGVKVPQDYKRIHCVTKFPRQIQEELVKYPETIEGDPCFESDSAVQGKSQADAEAYIKGNDESNRNAVEMNAEPHRIQNARVKRGHTKVTNIGFDLKKRAVDISLAAQGLTKEMTQERRDGKVQAPDPVKAKAAMQKELANQIQQFIEVEGSQLDYKSAQMLINEFRATGNYPSGEVYLKDYPKVIECLYSSAQQEIPADLLPPVPAEEIIPQESPYRGSSRLTENPSTDKKRKREIQQDSLQVEDSIVNSVEAVRPQTASIIVEESHENYNSTAKFMGKNKIESKPPSDSEIQREVYPEVIDVEELISPPAGESLDKKSSSSSSYFEGNLANDKEAFQAWVKKGGNNSSVGKQLPLQQASGSSSELKLSSSNSVVLRQQQMPLPAVLEPFAPVFQNLDVKNLPSLELAHQDAVPFDENISFDKLQLSNPWLQEKVKCMKESVQKDKKAWKPKRSESAIVNIDGKDHVWKQFKQNFAEDQIKQMQQGIVPPTSRDFVLNQGKSNEKLLTWTDKHGWGSEDSENQDTKFNTFHRAFLRERLSKHKGKPYLVRRPLKPFEHLLLRICEPILHNLMQKPNVDQDHVYMWQLPNQDPDFRVGDFLRQQSIEEFQQMYDEELSYQRRVVDNPEQYLFASELEELWHVAQEQAPSEVRQKMPSEFLSYIWGLNVEQMTEVTQEEILREQMGKMDLNEPEVQEYVSDQDFDGQDELLSQQQSAKRFAEPPRQSKAKVAQMYPKETEMPDYRQFKRMKLNDNTNLPVMVNDLDDFVDHATLFKIRYPPEAVKEKIIPMLQELVDQSSGKFQKFVIWPEFIIDQEQQGRPKRDGSMKFQRGDMPIMIAGCQIGKLIRAETQFNWLTPTAWNGQGIPLFPLAPKLISPIVKASNKEKQRQQSRNPRKRTKEQFYDQSAILKDLQPNKSEKSAGMRALESTFQFIKTLDKTKGLKVDRMAIANDTDVKIYILMSPGAEIKQTIALLKSVNMGDAMFMKDKQAPVQLSLSYDKKIHFLKIDFKIPAASMFTLKNTGAASRLVRLQCKL